MPQQRLYDPVVAERHHFPTQVHLDTSRFRELDEKRETGQAVVDNGDTCFFEKEPGDPYPIRGEKTSVGWGYCFVPKIGYDE